MSRLSNEEIEHYFQNSVDIKNRVIYISSGSYYEDGEGTGIDGALSERVIKGLHILENHTDNKKPITIQLNCAGGDYVEGMAIYDAIKECKSRIIIKVYGQASSMGSVILQAANLRIMTLNSTMLLHYGDFSISTDSISATVHAEFEKNVRKNMEDLYLSKIRKKHPKFTRNKIQEMLKHDTILSASEAVNLGLADLILGEDSYDKF